MLALAACSGPKDAFECTDNASCRNGAMTGTCEPTGFCSFPDPSCSDGARYGEAAGSLSGQCVGAQGSDSGVIGDGNDNAEPRALGAWGTTTTMPVLRHTHATAVAGNHVYVIGGIEGSTPFSDVWLATANPAAILPSGAITTWAQTTSMPGNRRAFGAAYDAGYLYVFGGRIDGSPDSADVLAAPVNSDGTLGAWTATSPLAQTIMCEAVASSGSHVYVIGGKHNGQGQAVVLHGEMSAGAVTWSSGGALDVTTFNEAAVAANGYLYVFGGCATGVASNCMQVLDVVEVAKINADGSLGAFAQTTSLPSTLMHHTAVAVPSNGDIYVLSGRHGGMFGDPGSTEVLAAHQHADGTLGPWRTMTPLPNSRERATSAVVGKYMLLLHYDSQVVPIQ